MGIKRVVDTSFWTDSKIDRFTSEEKYFYLFLLTNPASTQLGIYELNLKLAAYQLGYNVETINGFLERFENEYEVIYYSPETSEVAIKNFLKHSIIKGGKPVKDCLEKEIKKVKNKELLTRVFSHIGRLDMLNATVCELLAEYEGACGTYHRLENQNKNDNENNNDNENEASYDDTHTDSMAGAINYVKAAGWNVSW